MRVGIITIHKIYNYGSALQAYALQNFIQNSFNVECEIINYKFPNKFHIKNRNYSLSEKFRRIIHQIRMKCQPKNWIKERKFKYFWKKHLILSAREYKNQEEIKSSSFDYDLFITGSDQVWNTTTLVGDDVYMLSFVDDKIPKISYASSFGISRINEKYLISFAKFLMRYKAISVRESTGQKILTHIDNRLNSEVVCDPTLLLTKDDYSKIAIQSDLSINFPFILVYYLNYAFDPTPGILNSINVVYKKLKYKVIFINNFVKGFTGNYEIIKGMGPLDFLYLFKNASFVITSSFHGTAFSIINRKPFVSIAPRNKDSRIGDFLYGIGLNNNLVYSDDNNPAILLNEIYNDEFEENFDKFIRSSKEFLYDNIKSL